jgi:DNA-damage-inducible protein J
MSQATTEFLAQVPARRLRRAEKILEKLGLTPSDAVNIFFAQVEIRRGLPFDVSMEPKPLLSADEQATVWTEALGAY